MLAVCCSCVWQRPQGSLTYGFSGQLLSLHAASAVWRVCAARLAMQGQPSMQQWRLMASLHCWRGVCCVCCASGCGPSAVWTVLHGYKLHCSDSCISSSLALLDYYCS
jgi:hypothetical protein